MTTDELAQLRTEVRLGTMEGMSEHMEKHHIPLVTRVDVVEKDVVFVRGAAKVVAVLGGLLVTAIIAFLFK